MPTPLDDIRFLSDSANRFTALAVLAEGPRTRADLKRETGASAATISRLLGDFESRGWARRDGHEYELTPLGEYVAGAFVDLHEHMTTASELRELLPWFPLGELDVEVEMDVLNDATITAATPENPMASVARVLEIERESRRTRTLATRFPKACIDARYEAIVERGQTCELILTPKAVTAALESPNAEKFDAIVAAEGATLYVHDGEVVPGGLADGSAYLIVADDDDANVGVIESDDPAVVEQVEATFEAYREASTRLTPSTLEEQRDAARAGS